MEPLLQMTSVPVKISYETEPSRLEYRQNLNPTAEVGHRNAALRLNSKRIELRLDMTDMRRSMGFQTLENIGASYRTKAAENVRAYMENEVQTGRAMGRIQDGVSIGQVIRQKLLEQPETQMVFLPEVGPRISWDPNRLEVEYQEGELAYDWKIARNILEYIPGKFQINIVQYPRVDIRYVGKSGEFPEGPAGDGKNETAGSRSAAC